MIPILTPAESGALDRASAERGVSVESLMEKAGRAVARAALRVAGGTYGRRVVVVCGKGNNGGDGLVAARYLERWGMGVTVLILADPDAFQGPAAANFHRFAGGDGRWPDDLDIDGTAVVPFDRDCHVLVMRQETAIRLRHRLGEHFFERA